MSALSSNQTWLLCEDSEGNPVQCWCLTLFCPLGAALGSDDRLVSMIREGGCCSEGQGGAFSFFTRNQFCAFPLERTAVDNSALTLKGKRHIGWKGGGKMGSIHLIFRE